MILSKEDIEFIEYSKAQMDKGRYSDIQKLTEVYNRCYSDLPNYKAVQSTNCSSCIRHRIGKLYGDMQNALNDIR